MIGGADIDALIIDLTAQPGRGEFEGAESFEALARDQGIVELVVVDVEGERGDARAGQPDGEGLAGFGRVEQFMSVTEAYRAVDGRHEASRADHAAKFFGNINGKIGLPTGCRAGNHQDLFLP